MALLLVIIMQCSGGNIMTRWDTWSQDKVSGGRGHVYNDRKSVPVSKPSIVASQMLQIMKFTRLHSYLVRIMA